MSKEFQILFARNIISIVLGEDIDDQFFTMKIRESPQGFKFIDKQVNLSAAIMECWEQLVCTFVSRFCNPLWLGGFTGLKYDYTSYQRQVRANCNIVREFVRSYVRERKSGKRTSKVKDNSDILSLFF